MNKNVLCTSLLACTASLMLGTTASATEGGLSSWPMGIEIYGMGILPPPGTYGQVFVGNYLADSLRDDAGRKAADIDLRATTIVPRFVWVTEQQVLGGNLGFHALLPLNDIRLNVKNGPHDHKRGIGDAHLGPVIGFHHSEKLHSAVGIDFVLPTGSYDRDDLVNLGNNTYTVQAVYALTYTDPAGFNADVRLMHDYNFENRDTHYQSGRELHADYTLGWGLGNGWVVGVGGHAYQQISDDKCSASNCASAALVDANDGNRGRSFSIGPAVQYTGEGWFLSAKWQDESGVRNRAEGQTYWLKFTMPL
ncbi:SphA family protein [Metapseudomonas furukawaii]|uniref:Protein involved in meta-pathway of phenol degradation n=1 Tax=Metapseudomonas furukawaii TaxID=1149133 RepID=A0AAD1C4D7_METFU|nr:transporter [Pseudomonas furukawaii]ELS29614.1 Protein involved in meta-pathway of phenol degradation [Pseudomonas furukawaii]BAU76640.1 protein involved in meta-pathway of phenol degradation [Pseudomonas furukawaii]